MRKPKPLDPQRFQCAVMTLALGRAKYRVLDQIRSEGLKVSHFSCREINDKRDQYFALHMEELITQALVDVWQLPQFARHREQSGASARSLSSTALALSNHDKGEHLEAYVMAEPSVLPLVSLTATPQKDFVITICCPLRAIIDRG
jgi:hypothetical protein